MIKLNIELPRDFLKEECRDGYNVSKKMKEVWAVELDLLKKFQEVCEKYKLIYFAESGTLLGAIRHGGFIPWDDDIDVVMMRTDYIKLCEVAAKEFTYPYFFQTEETDPGTVRGHAQLRNSKTTGILVDEKDSNCKFNQGIFLDIFPLDNIPPVNEQLMFWNKLDYLRNKAREFAKKNRTEGTIVEPNPYYQELEELSQKYNHSNTAIIGTVEYTSGRRDMTRKKEDYLQWKEWKFEFLKINVPIGHERILLEQYGNWRKYVVAKTAHKGVFFDTEKSYIEYLEDKL